MNSGCIMLKVNVNLFQITNEDITDFLRNISDELYLVHMYLELINRYSNV